MYLIKDPQYKTKLESIAGAGAYDPADEIIERIFHTNSKHKVYPLYLRDPHCIKNKDFLKAIDKEYMDDLRKGTIQLLIIMITESFDIFETHRWKQYSFNRKRDISLTPYGNVVTQLIKNNIPLDNVLWLTSLADSDIKKDIEFLKSYGITIFIRFKHFNYFLHQQRRLKTAFLPLEKINRVFLSMSAGTPRHHRYGLTYNMFSNQLLKYGKVSCSAYKNFSYSSWGSIKETEAGLDTDSYIKKLSTYSKNNLEQFKKTLPLIIDDNRSYAPEIERNSTLFHDIFVDVVNETHPLFNDKVFITEKTFKTIRFSRPFIINGDRFSLKYLKSLGFKTFDRWWNEDYDDCDTDWKRIDRITDILIDLCQKDKITLMQMYKEMQPIIEHNYNLLKEYRHESLY